MDQETLLTKMAKEYITHLDNYGYTLKDALISGILDVVENEHETETTGQ